MRLSYWTDRPTGNLPKRVYVVGMDDYQEFDRLNQLMDYPLSRRFKDRVLKGIDQGSMRWAWPQSQVPISSLMSAKVAGSELLDAWRTTELNWVFRTLSGFPPTP